MARILVVDDAPFMRTLITTLLADDGHAVVADGEDGEAAIRLYFETRPDVLLVDVMMPVKDGLQATREIMRRDPNARIIVISSSRSQAEAATAARKAGAAASLEKPLDPAALRATLKAVLAPRAA